MPSQPPVKKARGHELQVEIPPGTPAAVCWNAPREDGLAFAVDEFVQSLPPLLPHDVDWRSRKILLIQADISRGKSGQPLCEKDKRSIRKVSSKRLGATGNLFMILGAKYMNLQNDHVPSKLANGTVGILQSIVLVPSARIRTVALENAITSLVHAVYASEVEALMFKHDTPAFKSSNFFPELPQGCFPVVAKTFSKKFNFGGDALVSATVTQFQITLACVLTGHKMQGRSVDSIILGDLVGADKYGATGWLYVVLSRVRTLSGLYTLQLLTEDLSKYKPRTAVINEMERLRKIGSQTMNRLCSAIHGMSASEFISNNADRRARRAQVVVSRPLGEPTPDPSFTQSVSSTKQPSCSRTKTKKNRVRVQPIPSSSQVVVSRHLGEPTPDSCPTQSISSTDTQQPSRSKTPTKKNRVRVQPSNAITILVTDLVLLVIYTVCLSIFRLLHHTHARTSKWEPRRRLPL